MNEKILETITQLLEAGGNMALTVYIIHMVAGILKYVVGFGFLYIGLRHLGKVVNNIIVAVKESK